MVDERSKRAVEVAESYADGLVTDKDLESVANAASEAWPTDEKQYGPDGHLLIPAAAYNAAVPIGWWGGAPSFMPPSSIIQEAAPDPTTERRAQAAILRDIFNPFRLVTIDPSWLTSTVVALAEGIYAERAFDRMPILADALEDAGCNNADILNHCRGDGPHVRGCWVVDFLLGKV
ncbi:MAG: hypothetical protein U0792_07630 [Gemmataceae bacterium]